MGTLQRGPVPEAACPRGTEEARLRMLEGLNVGLGEGERTVFLAGRWVDSMAITDGATGRPRGQFSWLSVGHGTMGRGSWTRDRCTDLESSVGSGGLEAKPCTGCLQNGPASLELTWQLSGTAWKAPQPRNSEGLHCPEAGTRH